MGIDTQVGGVFVRRRGQVIRHMQKHQGIDMEFRYVETDSGSEFDVRDLPGQFMEGKRDDVLRGQREAHKAAITRAIDCGHEFGLGAG